MRYAPVALINSGLLALGYEQDFIKGQYRYKHPSGVYIAVGGRCEDIECSEEDRICALNRARVALLYPPLHPCGVCGHPAMISLYKNGGYMAQCLHCPDNPMPIYFETHKEAHNAWQGNNRVV